MAEVAAAPIVTENWEENVAPMTDVPEVKLFGKWTSEDLQVSDISLTVGISKCVL